MYETLVIETRGPVATVWLNRPEVHNAFNAKVIEELTAAFTRLDADAQVRVVVLAGRGKSFSAGADLNWMKAAGAASFEENLEDARRLARMLWQIAHLGKPTIARVHGAALGGGMGLAAACDILYASSNATFGMPEINVGLAGGASMLKTLLGRSTMRRMFFTGQRLTAQEMLKRNVLEDVLEPEELLPVVMDLAREIASKAPLALIYAKRAANMVDLMPQRDAYRFEQEFTMALAKTEDAKEARMAFLEKRAPVFKGR